MDIFESLENLNVSEECFDEIMDMVEEFVYRNEPLPDDKPIATGWNNGDGTYKAVVFKSKKGKWNDPDTNKHLDGKTFKSMKGAENYAHRKGYVVSTVRDRIADVKEDLNVSEKCFDEIMDIVETLVGRWKEKGFPANKGAKDEMIVNLHPGAIEKENKKAEVAGKELKELRAKAKEGKADFTDLFSKNFEKEAAKNKAYWLKKDMEDAQKRLDTQNKYKQEAIAMARMKKDLK